VLSHGAGTSSCYRPTQLIVEGLGLYAWVPNVTPLNHYVSIGVAYSMTNWFVSALFFCFLFEPLFIRLAAMLQLHAGPGRVPWLTILLVIVFVLASPTADFPFTWRWLCRHVLHSDWESCKALLALHVYFCGCALAAYLHSRADAGLPPFRFAASSAAIALAVVFSLWFVPIHLHNAPEVAVSMHLLQECGLGLALFLPIIAGLAGGADPLARALCALPSWANDLARDLSGPMYMLQHPAALLLGLLWTWGDQLCNIDPRSGRWPIDHRLGGGPQANALWVLGLLAILVSAAALVHFGLQKPIASAVGGVLGR